MKAIEYPNETVRSWLYGLINTENQNVTDYKSGGLTIPPHGCQVLFTTVLISGADILVHESKSLYNRCGKSLYLKF